MISYYKDYKISKNDLYFFTKNNLTTNIEIINKFTKKINKLHTQNSKLPKLKLPDKKYNIEKSKTI